MSTQIEELNLKSILLDEFAERRNKNPAYSLRAFSRDMGVNVTSLSQFFSGCRVLSVRSLNKIKERLGISSFYSQEKKSYQLEEDAFKTISEWYYYAILSLARIKVNKASPEWIAKRLGISVIVAKGALERLYRMKLIQKVGNRLYRTGEKITTTNNVPSSSIRNYHKKNLELALNAMERVPFQQRFETAITMPADPKKLKAAGELMVKFREDLSEFLESGETSEVYTMLIHLFPLTITKSRLCD